MSASIHSIARSSAPDVRNPLLKLPSAAAFEHLAEEDRRQLRAALDAIRRRSKQVADDLWERGRVRKAAYWRACSVYAGHAARLAHTRSSAPTPSVAPAPVPRGINPVAVLAAPELSRLSDASLSALVDLLLDLRADAKGVTVKSWRTAKSPMAAYWNDVKTVAGHCARRIDRLRPRAVGSHQPVQLAA